MNFPSDYLEPIFTMVLVIFGAIIYAVATRNRGSFADTPDWSKVVRRVVELVCLLVSIMILSCLCWGKRWYLSTLLIASPLIFILVVPALVILFKFIIKKDIPSTEKLSEHLANAIILALFLLSGMMVFLITLLKMFDQPSHILFFSYVVLDLLLCLNFAFLTYQLYYFIVEKNIPSDEDVQIVRICKELNE